MTRTNSRQELIEGIEQLVREHLAVTEREARAAVARAFGGSAQKEREVEPTKRRAPPERRRDSREIAALGERFYGVVSAKPGEKMSVLAAEVGASAQELHRAVSLLRGAGRVRVVGQRSQTRYFPMASGRGSQAAAAGVSKSSGGAE